MLPQKFGNIFGVDRKCLIANKDFGTNLRRIFDAANISE